MIFYFSTFAALLKMLNPGNLITLSSSSSTSSLSSGFGGNGFEGQLQPLTSYLRFLY